MIKRVLVTGGAGFIGTNLVEDLLKKGYFVRCLDNFSTGKKSNIEPFKVNPNFELIEGDIRDLEICKKATNSIDYVLHHAALGSVPRSIKDPITSNDVNVSGFLNMLIASKNDTVKRFIYAASSSTYGDSESMPKQEDIIGKPLSPYAVTKYVNELYADVFYKTDGLETIGLRYFNIFGARQDTESVYTAVIPAFVDSMIKHKSPTINGDGTYSRDFTYIENVVYANILCMETENKKAVNQVYNIACGSNTNLNDLYKLLQTELSKFDKKIVDIHPIYGDFRKGDVPHTLASIDKAKKLLGYIPLVQVEEGIKKSCEWYWNNL